MQEEIWLPVKGYGKYFVSNKGRVKSFERNKHTGIIINAGFDKDGYVRICLRLNKTNHHMRAHRLVAIAFIPNPENKLIVNHINGIKDDNRVENLEWCTNQENISHAASIGLMATGARNGNSKLTNEDVKKVREMLMSGQTQRSISKIFGVHEETIGNINRGHSWQV